VGSRKAAIAAKKLATHQDLWDKAKRVLSSVDPEYARRFTALAVTHDFEGSPHIDRQNVGPFYGLSLGSFEEGTGGVRVECSARVVGNVNTKDRLGRIDGRFPHWVAPYDKAKGRYSLIFYTTKGEIDEVSSAIFAMPRLTQSPEAGVGMEKDT
jgi:hypothetical protein